MNHAGQLFFRQYKPSSSYMSIVEVRKDPSCIKLIDYVDNIFNVMPRNFIITTKGGPYRFNTEFLTDTCLSIRESLQNNPDLLTFDINIKDKNNVMQKIEQMFLGKEIIFNENDISTLQKITKSLKLTRCPNFMKPESLRTSQDTYALLESNKSYSLDVPVSLNKQSVLNFFSDTNSNAFKIKTKNNEYGCNSVSVLLSQVIYDKKQEDPTLTEFFYDFDDEFNEFNEISSFFNFNSIQITPSNMNSFKNIAEDLEINCILPRINDFIYQYEQTIQKINDKQKLVEPVDQLFEWLYNIKKLSPKTVSDLIIESIWIHTEENVQELAACILQVIFSGFILHPFIYELLVLLDKSFDIKTNNLNILIPFITQKLLSLFGQTRCICAFVYMLFKKDLISKEDFYKKISSGFEIIQRKISYGFLTNDNDSMIYDFQANGNIDNNYCANIILWFFPELFEISQFSMEMTNKILDETQQNFIDFYYPNNIDKFNKMRDEGEPDDEITKSLIHDDVDKLQSIVSNGKIDIEKEKLAFNIFESFIVPKDMNYLNYSAAYGSIKCFKYLLLNHAAIDNMTFQYAVFGGNVEIIRIVEQQQNGGILNKSKNFASYQAILPAIRNHYNNIFDWIMQNICNNKDKINYILSRSIFASIINGNAHAFIECINNGFDLNSLSKNAFQLMVQKSCECGFFRFTQLIFLFIKDSFDFNDNDSDYSRFNRTKIDLCVSSVLFGNLSIFKLIINKIHKNLRTDLEKALMKAVQIKCINIIKYICETEKFALLLKNNKTFSIDRYLNLAIQINDKNSFYYLVSKFRIRDAESVLITACESKIFDIVEYLTDFILKNNPNFEFSKIFIKSASYKSEKICQYFIDKRVNLDFSLILSSLQKVLKNEKIFFILIKIIDANLKESFMVSSLQNAIKNKQYKIVEYLLKEKIPDFDALVESIENRDIDMINIVLKYDSQPCYINRVFKKGTALNVASKLSDLSTVKRLLSIPGIDPNIPDANNFTPLISAVFNLNLEIINCILDFYGERIQQQKWQLDKSIKVILNKLSNKPSIEENANFGYVNENFLQMMKNENNSPDSIRKMVNILNRLLEIKNIDVNCYEGNISILSFACKSNEIDLVKLLLQHDQIDVNSYLSEKGDTPLMIAIICNHLEIAKLLINFAKTNLNHKNYDDETALTIASQKDLKEIVSLILNDNRFDPIESNINYAFYLSYFSVAQLLYNLKDLDVNRCLVRKINEDKKEDFLLMSKLVDSVSSNDIKMIDLIVSHPSFDIYKSNTKSALFSAVVNDQIEIFRKLVKILKYEIYFSDQSILVCAVINQSYSIINEILDSTKFDIEKLDIVGAFINSIQPSSDEIVDSCFVITKQLFDFDKKNGNLIDLTKLVPFTKFSGLHDHLKQSFFTLISDEIENVIEFANFFLNNGVDPNMPDEYGVYPLEHSIIIESFELFNALIESGKIDFNTRIKNRMNQTFLHVAAMSRKSEFLRELMNIDSIDVNSVDDDGNTPLILAVNNVRSENIKILFTNNNLDYLKTNNNGVNVLTLAKSLISKYSKFQTEIDESLSKEEICYKLHLIVQKSEKNNYY